MKPYEIYKRGDKYRLARPTWFNWNWHSVLKSYRPGFISDVIFETTDITNARAERINANKTLAAAESFKHSKWELLPEDEQLRRRA